MVLFGRKKQLTTRSSARWANAIIAGNDDQYRLARDAQLTAAWALPSVPYRVGRGDTAAGEDVYATGPVVGVDLNDGRLAMRRLTDSDGVG